jgi:prepilin-type processing-associated H-X9-DG protein
MDVVDGTSNTIAVGERPAGPTNYDVNFNGWWSGLDTIGWRYGAPGWEFDTIQYVQNSVASPSTTSTITGQPCTFPALYAAGKANESCDFNHFWSFHAAGANFLFADGSVRFLPYTAQPIMIALATRSGGEAVDTSKY